jgi:hypothetical protein
MYRPGLVLFDGGVVLRTGHRFGLDASMESSDVRFLQRHTDSDAYSNPDTDTDTDTDSHTDANANTDTYPDAKLCV